MEPIGKVAKRAGLTEDEIDQYGKYKAKISLPLKDHEPTKRKLVLVTAINPTPAGEGKSTVTVGLADAMQLRDKKTMIALREPSLGPVMGMKGGATGGGYSQVVPMEDINLHFTGDMHALTAANNTLAALIDNHIHQGNQLGIDQRRVIWKRVVDINDRALRHVVVGLGGPTSGVPREDGFDITVASELMAIICLAKDIADLKKRIGRIVIGYTFDRQPVTVDQLGVTGAIAVLLKDAIKPNLVQTLAHTPAVIHGGPFANIAHGCNSVFATKTCLDLADYTITEAGFGADLGAEKFLDIKAPVLGKTPDAVVIVATVRALKMNGGVSKKSWMLKTLQQSSKAMQILESTFKTCNATDCRFSLRSTVSFKILTLNFKKFKNFANKTEPKLLFATFGPKAETGLWNLRTPLSKHATRKRNSSLCTVQMMKLKSRLKKSLRKFMVEQESNSDQKRKNSLRSSAN